MTQVRGIKVRASDLAEPLIDIASPTAGSVLNGRFKNFCELLREHYRHYEVEVPERPTTLDIAMALKKLGNMGMPSIQYREIFDKQVAILSEIPPVPVMLKLAA